MYGTYIGAAFLSRCDGKNHVRSLPMQAATGMASGLLHLSVKCRGKKQLSLHQSATGDDCIIKALEAFMGLQSQNESSSTQVVTDDAQCPVEHWES